MAGGRQRREQPERHSGSSRLSGPTVGEENAGTFDTAKIYRNHTTEPPHNNSRTRKGNTSWRATLPLQQTSHSMARGLDGLSPNAGGTPQRAHEESPGRPGQTSKARGPHGPSPENRRRAHATYVQAAVLFGANCGGRGRKRPEPPG